jgi:hypothetical protein
MTRDEAERRAALTRLAVATRERLPESRTERDAFFRVYLDDTERFPTSTFTLACRRLEMSLDWFPKKHELVEACAAVARHKADEQTPKLALPSGDKPVSEETLANFRADVAKLIKDRTMR